MKQTKPSINSAAQPSSNTLPNAKEKTPVIERKIIPEWVLHTSHNGWIAATVLHEAYHVVSVKKKEAYMASI